MKDTNNPLLADAVSSGNFSRKLVVEKFSAHIQRLWSFQAPPEPFRVAVLGGSPEEPEVLALTALVPSLEVKTYGIDRSDEWLDLNVEPDDQWSTSFTPHLILCSQVLEHVWNHETAFKWLSVLAPKGGYLWLAAPAANRPHGSPDYYSAGFTDSYLAQNLSWRQWNVLNSGTEGTQRLYKAALTTDLWLTQRGHKIPLAAVLALPPHRRMVPTTLRRFTSAIRLLFTSTKVRSDVRYATESWVLA